MKNNHRFKRLMPVASAVALGLFCSGNATADIISTGGTLSGVTPATVGTGATSFSGTHVTQVTDANPVTGQIYTADDAKANKLIDEIGFEEDALESLKERVNLKDPRIITYESPTSLVDILMGNASEQSKVDPWRAFMESTVPRAMYYCSWLPPIP